MGLVGSAAVETLSSDAGDDDDDDEADADAGAGANPAAATCDASAANSMRTRLPKVRNEEDKGCTEIRKEVESEMSHAVARCGVS